MEIKYLNIWIEALQDILEGIRVYQDWVEDINEGLDKPVLDIIYNFVSACKGDILSLGSIWDYLIFDNKAWFWSFITSIAAKKSIFGNHIDFAYLLNNSQELQEIKFGDRVISKEELEQLVYSHTISLFKSMIFYKKTKGLGMNELPLIEDLTCSIGVDPYPKIDLSFNIIIMILGNILNRNNEDFKRVINIEESLKTILKENRIQVSSLNLWL